MKKYLQLIFLFLSGFGFAQDTNLYEAIDKKMDAIPASMTTSTESIVDYIAKNFSTNDDKIRAAFYWTASNISYDVVAIGSKRVVTTEQRITNTLQSRKGVCMNYAYVFKDITSKLGIETVLVGGYTKSHGEVAELAHMWCASKLNGNWYLFDPTWGAGYVDKRKFFKKLDNKFYKADPKSLIPSHMPFDYLWQFSSNPINNQEFYDGKSVSENKKLSFDYMTEIAAFQNLSELEKAKASAYRIEKNGVKNKLIAEHLEYEKSKVTYEQTLIGNAKNKESFDSMQQILSKFKEANMLFTQFLKYRSTKFLPMVTDAKIKSKIQDPYDLLLQCEIEVNEIKTVQKENEGNFATIKSVIANSKRSFETQLAFVNEYLSKDKAGREKMFGKR